METRYLLPVISCLCGLAATACNTEDDIGQINALQGRAGSTRTEIDNGTGSTVASNGQALSESTRRDQRPGECTFGDEGPCEVFVTNDTDTALGPYGAETEYNVGQGFENDVRLVDRLADRGSGSGIICGIVDLAGPAISLGRPLPDTGDLDFALYTVYRPADMVSGERYPVIVWGNGACIPSEGYGALLRFVASQGYIIVAPNSRLPGDTELIRGIDFMFDADGDPQSPYYGKVDTSRVGAMGHFVGARAAARAARVDSRIKTVVLFSSDEPTDVPFLAIAADNDFREHTVTQFQNAIREADAAAFIFYHMVHGSGEYPGEFLMMSEPERVLEPTWRWFEYQLFDDQDSGDLFAGPNCGLCDLSPELTYSERGLR